MKKILIPALMVLAAVIVSPIRAADLKTPFPSPKLGKVFVAAQTAHDGRGDEQLLRARQHGRLPRVRRRRKDAQDPHDEGGEVLLREDPRCAQRQDALYAEGQGSERPVGMDGSLEGAVGLHARDRPLPGPGHDEDQETARVQTSAGVLGAADDHGHPPAPAWAASELEQHGRDREPRHCAVCRHRQRSGRGGRPIGCTQTNVFKRGEEVVVRTWGFDLKRGAVLSNDNVDQAYFSVPGVSKINLNWGAHGPQQVFMWTNAWTISMTYPLGDVVIQIQFTTITGKVGKLAYPITIIP